MKNSVLVISFCSALIGSNAMGVSVDGRGAGEVLIFPYYTVNKQQTLFSIFNSTAHGKALKVRFREGYNGRDVANFNVYLAPYDAWVGSIFDTSGTGTAAAAIASTDESCTVPAFDKTFFPGGAGVLVFSNQNYSQGAFGQPTGIDNGRTTLDRTREGFVEVIEMGEVADQATGTQNTLESISPQNPTFYPSTTGSVPNNCAKIVKAWTATGYWSANPTTDILPPTGGLYGSAAIVNVGQGTIFPYDATAIAGFSDVSQHTNAGNAKPNLSTAVTDSVASVTTAYVPIGSTMVRADYPAATQGIDAVSAVLSADTVLNEFDIEPDLGAASDLVFTFPTKQFYVDPGIVGTSDDSVIAPFQHVFGAAAGTGSVGGIEVSCTLVDVILRNRAGQSPPFCQSDCPYVPTPNACFETSIFTFHSSTPTRAINSVLVSDEFEPNFLSGEVLTVFEGLATPEPLMRASSQGNVFHGFPVVGFAAINYQNGNVTPSVLSNYSALYPHRVSASCTNAADPQLECH